MPKVDIEYEERKRNDILNAALLCFARKGYYETRMDDIVAESGLSKGSIYRYFKSKEELFLSLQDRHLKAMKDNLIDALSSIEGATEKLKKGAEYFFTALCKEHAIFARITMEFWSEAARNKNISRRFCCLYEDWHAFVVNILKEGIKRGEIKKNLDVNSAASVIMAACDGLILHWISHGNIFDISKVKDAFLSGILYGIAEQGKKKGKS